MAHHAFNFAHYDPTTKTLTVEGTTERELGPAGVEIVVAAVDADTEERRCELEPDASDKSALGSWHASIVNGPFFAGDDIFAVGMAKSDLHPDPFLWAERFKVEAVVVTPPKDGQPK